MARGFNWHKVSWHKRLRDQGDEHYKDKKKQCFVIRINGQRWNKRFETKLAALKAAQTIRHRHGHRTEVVSAK
jgi:uncharacterized protein YlbG (UPF0298 family)